MRLDVLFSNPTKGSAGKTGEWRVFRPVVDQSLCVLCMSCYDYCPENVVEVGDEVVIDYDYCKGCGICSRVCVTGAIRMERER
ncbi:2-oxoacid:acceptor oxidoreductase, delta subunit, pyruvate/2-ketoisovalerate family [Geoglobus ahangari]|uniref:2-oxoacid:acceptor oxidoreductase, delta subunit, pyruvate/2-ketoisovalerate family n=1 Tax=Geoglobus ahangari TaxID=113653 RepID=A0A0F7IFT3_9EURY|nr:4Fe-4S binding protein [Geoglobus ahangari]AKG90707.1 2-oxoacid:acceptor oxidoreductase, delta subunit, pyruvate/2-ketoisovalerate family [Geoglobus ahangari]